MGARSPDTKIEAPLVQPTFKESRQTPHWVRFDYCPSSTSYRPTISSACVQLWSVRPLFASSTFPRQKLTQLISLSYPPSFNPTLFRVLAMGAGSLDPWPLGFASYLAVNRFPSSLNGFFIPKEEPAQYMWKWSISAQWKSLNESVSREKRPLHDFYLWDMYEAQV